MQHNVIYIYSEIITPVELTAIASHVVTVCVCVCVCVCVGEHRKPTLLANFQYQCRTPLVGIYIGTAIM